MRTLPHREDMSRVEYKSFARSYQPFRTRVMGHDHRTSNGAGYLADHTRGNDRYYWILDGIREGSSSASGIVG